MCDTKSDLAQNQMGLFTVQQRDTVLAFEMQLKYSEFFAVADGGTRVKLVEQNLLQHVYPVQ